MAQPSALEISSVRGDPTAEIAWAIGLFEGEGSWTFLRRRNGLVQPMAVLTMTDEDIVRRFAAVAGCGTVTMRSAYQSNRKPWTRWTLYASAQLAELTSYFAPWMGIRRRAKALEVTRLLHSLEPSRSKRVLMPPVRPLIEKIDEEAWAAGLFEAEGCWNTYQRANGYAQVQAKLSMTDEDVVRRFAAIAGCGTVLPTIPKEADRKLFWRWYLYEANAVAEVIQRFLPRMGERRKARALEVLEVAKQTGIHFGKRTACERGHPLSGDNLLWGTTSRGTSYRRCRTCERDDARRRVAVRRVAAPSRVCLNCGAEPPPLREGSGGRPRDWCDAPECQRACVNAAKIAFRLRRRARAPLRYCLGCGAELPPTWDAKGNGRRTWCDNAECQRLRVNTNAANRRRRRMMPAARE